METPLEQLYQSVWWPAFWTILIPSAIIAIITILIARSRREIGCYGSGLLAICFLSIALSSWLAPNIIADNAVTTGWQDAIKANTTYLEKLHGFFTKYNVEIHPCQYEDTTVDDSGIGTGCKYLTPYPYCNNYNSKKHRCDDQHYTYTPWFNHEETLTADLDVYQSGHLVFADHIAPENWQFYLYHGRSPGGTFVYQRPVEWLRIKQAIDSGQLIPGSTYHSYANWIHANDHTLFTNYGGHIPAYLNSGLLPKMETIHDTTGQELNAVVDPHDGTVNIEGTMGYDYNIVQFLGGLNVSPAVKQQWEQTAALWAAWTGPKLQASLILGFAPEDKINNLGTPDEWIYTSKAYLMQKSVFGKYILPKNLVLMLCGVSSNQTQVTSCRAETGMFTGNERLRTDQIPNLQSFGFTPQETFGTLTDQVKKGKQQITASLSYQGGVLTPILTDPRPDYGFHRVQMASFEYEKTNLEPTDEQKSYIQNQAEINAILVVVLTYVITFAGMGGFAYAASQN